MRGLVYAGVPGFCRLLESGVYVRGFSVCRVALGLRVTIVRGLVYAGVPGFCRLPKCGYGFSVLGFSVFRGDRCIGVHM